MEEIIEKLKLAHRERVIAKSVIFASISLSLAIASIFGKFSIVVGG